MTALIGLLATLLILESTGFGSVDVEAHPLIPALLFAGTPLAGAGVALALARRSVSTWRRRRLLRGSYLLAYLVTFAVIVHLVGWGDFVLLRLGWLGQPLVGHALLVLPGGLLALWAALWFYRAETQLLTRRAREQRRFGPWLSRSVRLISVPAGVFAVATAVTQCIGQIPALGSALEVYPRLAVLVGLAALAVVIAVFPTLLLLAWPSRTIPRGPLRSSLEEIAARVGVKLRDVRIWDRTSGLINACVVGHCAAGRRVLFTEGACEHLGDDDLRAVFAHEVAHVTSGHLWCYSAVLVAYVLALGPLQQSLDSTPQWLLGLAFLGLTAAVWLILFGCLSRRMETEADIRGAELAPEGTYLPAFDRVRVLLGSAVSARGGWRHFSLDRRRETLRSALTDPKTRRAHLSACRRWKLASCLLLVAAAAGFLWSAARDFTRSESLLALDHGAYALDQADELRRVLEAQDAGAGIPPWMAWLARQSSEVERAYSETITRASATLESRADPSTDVEAASLLAALEEHRSWWKDRG